MFRRLFVLLLPHVSCRSMALLYYKDPHLSLATGILYNFNTAFAIMVKHSCLCLVT